MGDFALIGYKFVKFDGPYAVENPPNHYKECFCQSIFQDVSELQTNLIFIFKKNWKQGRADQWLNTLSKVGRRLQMSFITHCLTSAKTTQQMLTFCAESPFPYFSLFNLNVNTQQPLIHVIINTNSSRVSTKSESAVTATHYIFVAFSH